MPEDQLDSFDLHSLIQNKKAARRDKDLDDVKHLEDLA
jgi:hypothetical protein